MTSHTLAEVASLLCVSVRTVETWIGGRELRAVNVSRDRQSRKARLRVMQSDLDAFLGARATDASPTKQSRRRRGPSSEIEQFV